MVMRSADRSLYRSLKPVKTTLIGIPSVFVGGVATGITLNSVINFAAATFPELTQFGAVYDDCRVVRIRHHYKLYCSTSAATPGLVYGSSAIVFDSSLANPTTTYAGLESKYSTPLLTVWTSTLRGDDRADSLRTLTAPTPPMTLVGTGPPGNSWFPIDTAPNICSLYGFIGAPSAAGAISYLSHFEIDVEFRVRV